FQQTAQRIHRLLFDEGEAGPVEQDLNFQDIRIAY
ncbi:ABC transporter, partial [Pseudomonas syringae pv. japonica str. M301072]